MMATNSPGRTSKLTPRSTCSDCSPIHRSWSDRGRRQPAVRRAAAAPRPGCSSRAALPAPALLRSRRRSPPPLRRARATTLSPAFNSPRSTSLKLSSARPSCSRCGCSPPGVLRPDIGGTRRIAPFFALRLEGHHLLGRENAFQHARNAAPALGRAVRCPARRGVPAWQRLSVEISSSAASALRGEAPVRPVHAARGGSRPSRRGISRSAPRSAPASPKVRRRLPRRDSGVRRPGLFHAVRRRETHRFIGNPQDVPPRACDDAHRSRHAGEKLLLRIFRARHDRVGHDIVGRRAGDPHLGDLAIEHAVRKRIHRESDIMAGLDEPISASSTDTRI